MDYDAFKNSVHDLINLDLNSYKAADAPPDFAMDQPL